MIQGSFFVRQRIWSLERRGADGDRIIIDRWETCLTPGNVSLFQKLFVCWSSIGRVQSSIIMMIMMIMTMMIMPIINWPSPIIHHDDDHDDDDDDDHANHQLAKFNQPLPNSFFPEFATVWAKFNGLRRNPICLISILPTLSCSFYPFCLCLFVFLSFCLFVFLYLSFKCVLLFVNGLSQNHICLLQI